MQRSCRGRCLNTTHHNTHGQLLDWRCMLGPNRWNSILTQAATSYVAGHIAAVHADTHPLPQTDAQQDSRPKRMHMQQSGSLHKKGHTRAWVGVPLLGAVIRKKSRPAQHCRCEGSHMRRPCNSPLLISLTSTTHLGRAMPHTESPNVKATERQSDAHGHQQGFTSSASAAAHRLGRQHKCPYPRHSTSPGTQQSRI